MHLNGNVGATQVIAYVVTGVGFLGAGVIMKQVERQARLSHLALPELLRLFLVCDLLF